MGEMFKNLANLSSHLYDGVDKYELDVYRSFRKTFESSRGIIEIMELYEPNSAQF